MDSSRITIRVRAGLCRSIVCSCRKPRLTAGRLLILLALGLGVCAHAWWTRTGGVRGEPVYTVAALRGDLERYPSAWLHRTVRVRAIPALRWCFVWTTPGPRCQLWEPALLSTGASVFEPLPLAWGSTPPLLAFVRLVPLLGAIVAPPQTVHWATPGIYRVQLQAIPCYTPAMSSCYVAMVLDGSP